MSSYQTRDLTYKQLLESILFVHQPKHSVEIGILHGFSLEIISKYSKFVDAFDIFDEFNGNHALKEEIQDKFRANDNVEIEYGNFYSLHQVIPNYSLDFLHIDIANNGEVYEFARKHYLKKLKRGGIMILEGGSAERDNVYWMSKYNKPAIQPVLKEWSIPYLVIGNMPSITIVKNVSNLDE